jgi:hypothetical protein
MVGGGERDETGVLSLAGVLNLIGGQRDEPGVLNLGE